MRRGSTFLWVAASLLVVVGVANASVVVIQDFNVDEGLFHRAPTYSGSTTGILATSTADRDTAMSWEGDGSQKLVLLDNPDTTSWFVRHLYNTGSGAQDIPTDGFIGFYVKTETPGLEVRIALDSPATADVSTYAAIPNDGQWHLVQWDMDDAGTWSAWASGDGVLAGLAGIDSIQFRSTADQDATLWLDYVAYDNAGRLPEPATLALLGLGGLFVARRRR